MSGIGIIVNPKHVSTHRAYFALVTGLNSSGIDYRTMSTTPVRSGRWQAEQLLDWGAASIIILGGDGTIRAAAPILAEAGVLTFIVPTGTANVLSRHLGFSSARQAIDHCIETVQQLSSSPTALGQSQERLVPVNTAEVRDAAGQWSQQAFLSLAGVGGDARAVAHHHLAPGLLGYMLGAGRALFAADLSAVTEREDPPRREPKRIWSLMASKAARPAGPVTVFPDADIAGREFSVLTVGPLPRRIAARLRAWRGIAAACLRGTPSDHRLMHYRRATSASIELTEPAPAQLDGDLIGDCLGLRVNAGEHRLRVSAPAS
ncbi:diacylglycerol/lipid kinase family protein [Brevibacterium spongiae]|uniref:NAD(+)/NADH kinase n=1 Tax=Brevibacterium spongiae TaxID=2909672 RepID=A0ABY5SSL5_9MICO|nr:diacylglycerol kinase family protein [Brevibacterium spongiae]UVI37558.1 NAD(+)/NADH kinase [Brevibacterium spongiae]